MFAACLMRRSKARTQAPCPLAWAQCVRFPVADTRQQRQKNSGPSRPQVCRFPSETTCAHFAARMLNADRRVRGDAPGRGRAVPIGTIGLTSWCAMLALLRVANADAGAARRTHLAKSNCCSRQSSSSARRELTRRGHLERVGALQVDLAVGRQGDSFEALLQAELNDARCHPAWRARWGQAGR